MPCARTRSSQRRASAGLRSPATPPARYRASINWAWPWPNLAAARNQRCAVALLADRGRRHAWHRARTSLRCGLWRPPARIAGARRQGGRVRRGHSPSFPQAQPARPVRQRRLRARTRPAHAPLRQHAPVMNCASATPSAAREPPVARFAQDQPPLTKQTPRLKAAMRSPSRRSLLEPPRNPDRIIRCARALQHVGALPQHPGGLSGP